MKSKRNWFKYLTRCLFVGHDLQKGDNVSGNVFVFTCGHCSHTTIDVASTAITTHTQVQKQQIGDRIIEFYIPSVFNENLKVANEIHERLRKQSKEGLSEEEKERLDKDIKSAYYKKWGKGYFRDGKDGVSLFKILGVSFDQYILPLIDKDGFISVGNINELKKFIEVFEIDQTQEFYKPRGDIIEDKNAKNGKRMVIRQELISEIEKQGRYRKFLKLLDQAIERNEGIFVKYSF